MNLIFVDIMTGEILSSIKVTAIVLNMSVFSFGRKGRGGVNGLDGGKTYLKKIM